jgi:hypothetical protein
MIDCTGASGIIGRRFGRPTHLFMGAVELHVFLLQQKLAPAPIADFHRKAFVQIN